MQSGVRNTLGFFCRDKKSSLTLLLHKLLGSAFFILGVCGAIGMQKAFAFALRVAVASI